MRSASCRCDARSNVDAFTRCRSRDQGPFYARNEAFALPKLDGMPISALAFDRLDASDLRGDTSNMIEGGTVPLGRRADYPVPARGHNIAVHWRTVERSFNCDVRALGSRCPVADGVRLQSSRRDTCRDNGFSRHTAVIPMDALGDSTAQQPHSNGRDGRQEDR
jgi:hypothetical protein